MPRHIPAVLVSSVLSSLLVPLAALADVNEQQTRGVAVIIGVNEPGKNHFNTVAKLEVCDDDAKKMDKLLRARGFETVLLINEEATLQAVTDQISHWAGELASGDTFVLYFAGHGGQVPDLNGDESDYQDEAICLFNDQLFDDELALAWYEFKSDVRVILVADCCHGGTLLRSILNCPKRQQVAAAPADGQEEQPRLRMLPGEAAVAAHETHKTYYEKRLAKVAKELARRHELQEPTESRQCINCRAAVMLIAACEENQKAKEFAFGGLFTFHLHQQLQAHGVPNLTYAKLGERLVGKLNRGDSPQVPQIYQLDTLSTVDVKSLPAFLLE